MIKQWTHEEDAIISMLYEQKRIEDWNQIARLAHYQYHLPQKNFKLYKDRYMNLLKSSVFKIDWSHEEELLFIKLHNEMGNKWATIAQQLSGKTDNCVKNHFYSKLRKLLRKLNKIIQFFLKKQFRPIDISIMYKIVQAAEQRFKQKPNCQQSVSLQCLTIENLMLQFAMFKDRNQPEDQDHLKYTPTHIEQYKELIKEIYRVSKLYKRKSKKVRNSLIQAPVNNYSKKTKKEQLKLQDQDQDQDQSEYKQQQQQKHKQKQKKVYKPKNKLSNTILVRKNLSSQSQNQSVKKQKQKYEEIDDMQEKNQKQKHIHKTNGRIQVQEGDGIQQLLRTVGILHDEVQMKNVSSNERNQRKYSSSQYSVSSMLQGSNNIQQSFLGTSNVQYSPFQSFTSQQMQNFLGFPMTNSNNYAKFTLSEKSSFKSFSQRDPSQIDNPFFDEYSSSNGRLMFPMNFNMPVAQQYQQEYNAVNQNGEGYGYQYGSNFYQQQVQEKQENGKQNGKRSKD